MGEQASSSTGPGQGILSGLQPSLSLSVPCKRRAPVKAISQDTASFRAQAVSAQMTETAGFAADIVRQRTGTGWLGAGWGLTCP